MTRSVLVVLSLAGCGSDDPATREPDPPEPQVDDGCVRATIGADGGTLEHPDGASLVVTAQDEGEVQLCLGDDDLWEILPATVTGVITLPAADGDGLFLPSADGGHARSPLEEVSAGGLSAPLWRGGTAWVAADRTVFRPYEPALTRVDILVLVDSSCSMSDVYSRIVEDLPVLGSYLEGSGIDFRLGVITADLDSPTDQGRLRPLPGGARWIEPTTPDLAAAFNDLVDVGTAGSNNEQGLGAIQAALDEPLPPENVGFRRDSARLVTLVVSNDDDFTSLDVVSLDDFVPWYREVGPFANDAALYGILSTGPGTPLTPRSTRYIEAIDQLGGATSDIRADDTWDVIAVMMEQAMEVAWPTLADSAPAPDTVQVWQIAAGVEPTLLAPASWIGFEETHDVRVDEALVPPGTPLVVSWVPAG